MRQLTLPLQTEADAIRHQLINLIVFLSDDDLFELVRRSGQAPQPTVLQFHDPQAHSFDPRLPEARHDDRSDLLKTAARRRQLAASQKAANFQKPEATQEPLVDHPTLPSPPRQLTGPGPRGGVYSYTGPLVAASVFP